MLSCFVSKHSLIPDLLQSWLQSLSNMFQFQYLVNVLEGDFLPRNSMYKGKLTLM